MSTTGHTGSVPYACAMPGCTNHSDEGRFVGSVCAPCYAQKPMLGMPSRRELFAAMAMQGLLAHYGHGDPIHNACTALQNADALLGLLANSSDETVTGGSHASP